MISFDEIKTYLPQYLSAESQRILFEELRQFPHNMDRLYSHPLSEDAVIYQGDGLRDMLVVNLPSPDIRPLPVMVLSNTCDIDPANERLFPSRIVYAPIFQLEKYRAMLMKSAIATESIIEAHISAIRQQTISSIFYLPKAGGLSHESLVFLDRLNNFPAGQFNSQEVQQKKIFTLSNYGFYMFLVKLSIHFTRVREGVDRLVE